MSTANELKVRIELLLNDLSNMRYSITENRQIVTDALITLKNMDSNSPEVESSKAVLRNLNDRLGDDETSLLAVHRYLTDYRMQVL